MVRVRVNIGGVTVVRPYRGVSAEQRRAERREQLLEACREVVGRDGVAATTVGSVCDQAGLTKRYFYESFTDLDAILLELLEELFAAVRTRILDALAPLDPAPPGRAHATIDALVAVMTEDPRRARLYVESSGHRRLRARLEQAYDAYVELWSREVLGHDELTPRRRAAALHHVAGTTQAVVGWLSGALVIERADLVAELAELGLPRVRSQ